MGEADPVRASYILPGVENVAESFNGYMVRGGGMDENLFLLDGNPVYNPTHMLGALSIINQTVVSSMRLYKSDFPAVLAIPFLLLWMYIPRKVICKAGMVKQMRVCLLALSHWKVPYLKTKLR